MSEDAKPTAGTAVHDSRDDPFAPREGKTLTWRNINMTLVSSKLCQCTFIAKCCIIIYRSVTVVVDRMRIIRS